MLVVVNRSHLELALPQLRDVPLGNVIVQPGNRDTGPGMVFGLLDLIARRPVAPVVVFPSDHYVVRVVPTDEDLMIARHTRTVLGP